MFHWCPEETAAAIAAAGAVKVSWTHRRAIWVALKGRALAAVAWLRRKLGIRDERHCCNPQHTWVVAIAQQAKKAEGRVLTTEEMAESFEAARAADRVISIKEV